MWVITHLRRLMQTSMIMLVGQSTTRQLRLQEGTHSGQDTIPSQGTLTPTLTFITETWWGETCKFHTDNGPNQEFFFSLISITIEQLWPEQCHSRTCSIGYMHYAVATDASSPQAAVHHWRGQAKTQPAAMQTTKNVWEKNPSSFCWQISSASFTFS